MAQAVPLRAAVSNDPRHHLGILGENLACAALEGRGYAILARRYRTKFGELDIVARDGDVTVFVEVKARAGDDFGGGAEAVTRAKQRKVIWMATDYLSRFGLHDRPCRFDVVTIDVVAGQPPRIEVYQHAFDATF